MNFLILLALLAVPMLHATTAAPRLLVPATKVMAWTNPILSPDGLKIVFTDASQKRIRALVLGEDSTREVITNSGVGRRYVFEPGAVDRIVYRRQINALPERPERLLSISIYLSDPASRTHNFEGKIFGPYLVENRVWYRDSLTGPLRDYEGKVRRAGPYLDLQSGELKVLNSAGKQVYASTPSQRFAAMEISPDGNWVAAVQTEPERELFLIHIEDGAVLKEKNAADPGWSGNSLSLICVRRTAGNPPELYRIHLPAGNGESVFQSPEFEPETPILNADGSRVVFASKGSIYDFDIAP